MLVKHKAIVLHSFPYGDNSRIVKCYTDKLGLQSYLVNGVQNKKGVLKPSMVLPLTQLNLVAYHKGKGGLERIKEAKLECAYSLINADPVRNALSVFIAEILGKVCTEDHPNLELYLFIENYLNALDYSETPMAYFHLEFLVHLSLYLGFKPSPPQRNFAYFDMMEGTFETAQPLHAYYLDANETTLFIRLLQRVELNFNKETRLLLLDKLLDYYRIQMPGFGEVKSLEVLKVLF